MKLIEGLEKASALSIKAAIQTFEVVLQMKKTAEQWKRKPFMRYADEAVTTAREAEQMASRILKRFLKTRAATTIERFNAEKLWKRTEIAHGMAKRFAAEAWILANAPE